MSLKLQGSNAFLVPSGKQSPKSVLNLFFDDLNDFEIYIIEKEVLQIEDVRYLQNLLTQSALKKSMIVFLDFYQAGQEAQNALLKPLEELGEDKLFFLRAEYPETLLGTILSRLQFVDFAEPKDTSNEKAEEFLKLDIDKRLSYIDKLRKGDYAELSKLIDSLEDYFSNNTDNHTAREALKNIFLFRRAKQLGAQPHKALLESLAFIKL